MLSSYAIPIQAACLLFPFVAAAFTLPFCIYHYRKYGSIPVLRVMIVYSFILYCMCVYFLTILPLPHFREVEAMAAKEPCFIPFNDIKIGLVKAGFSFSDLSTFRRVDLWKNFLFGQDLFAILANVLMMVPMGIYLRYYFRCSFRKAVMIGFLCSLFFEITQLTGLYGIYSKAYRYAEVDDLITNTLGTRIGFWLTPLVTLVIPDRERLDRMSYDRAGTVTVFRRLVALVLDLVAYSLFFSFSLFALAMLERGRSSGLLDMLLPLLTFPLYFGLFPVVFNGATPGQLILKLRTVMEDGGRVSFPRHVLKSLLLFATCLMLAFDALCMVVLVLLLSGTRGGFSAFDMIAVIAFTLVIVMSSAILLHSQLKYSAPPHAVLTHTRVVLRDPAIILQDRANG